VETGRKLIPSGLGIGLVHSYMQIDPEIVLPKVRSSIEKMCTQIAKGEVQYERVLDSAIELFRKKFIIFQENIVVMENSLKLFLGGPSKIEL
jgi:DNA topoisomerase III